MQNPVMRLVCSLMAKKITVCSGLPECSVLFLRSFPHGKCQGTVRILFFDMTYQPGQPFPCKISVLASLKYKGTKSQLITLLTTGKDILFCQTVALGGMIAPS